MTTQYLLNFQTGAMHPVWSDMDAVGLVGYYLDAADEETSILDMIRNGYRQSAGTTPYEWPVDAWRIANLNQPGYASLVSLEYPEDEPFREVSRVSFRDHLIIMFNAAMTAVIDPDGSIIFVARLD